MRTVSALTTAIRGGPLLVAFLLGSALVASAALNARDARFAAHSIAERQGMILNRQLRLRPGGEVQAALAQAVEDQAASYLALWEGARQIIEVGQSAFPGLPPTPGQLQLEDRRARMTFPAFRRGPGRGPESWPTAGPLLVIEFEPTAVFELIRRAELGLWLASSAAVLLMTAALVLWRFGRRADRLTSELERQRHLASLGQMAAVMAHEIRNPLASLKGHAQLLLEKAEDERTQARTKRVVDEAVRLEALTNHLLDFARAGAVQISPTSPAAVLERAVQATGPDRIAVDVSAAPQSWAMDGARLEQVLINLLENALQVAPGPVQAAIEAREGQLVFSVRDHGPGVPAEERARIFEPFHTTKTRGTGLGLAVAKRIVELHRGRIEVTDAEGGGALFRVWLPVVSAGPS